MSHSDITLAPRTRWSVRRFAAAASVLLLAALGVTVMAAPAHAAFTVQITDSADPVPVNTSYTYTVTATSTDLEFLYDVTADLSGAAATITDVVAVTFGYYCDPVGGTQMYCYSLLGGDLSVSVTFTVLPTAAGTVTTDTSVTGDFSTHTATETTTIDDDLGCTITGTPGNDTINGTNGDDVICGLGGDDVINGGNGSDTIHAGPGNDTVTGGNGDDVVYGEGGNDTLNGGNGNDHIYAGAGDDRTYGEDLLSGLLGWIFDNGNDHIDGGPGNDILNGQNGNDTLIDHDGADTLNGGNGTDHIDLQDGTGGDTANGGLGNDTCTVDTGDTTSSC